MTDPDRRPLPPPGHDPDPEADERILLLEEGLLEGPRRYTREQIAAEAGVPVAAARRLWRSLGFADVENEVAAFTDADLEALRRITSLTRSGVIDDEFAASLTRALGYTQSRLVMWLVEALVENVAERRRLDAHDAARTAVAMATERLDDFERLLLYAWRRQLAAVTTRALSAAEAHAQRGWLTVGFADLVSYTRLSLRLQERELAALVSRFERVSSDVVAANRGRLVKTVGDEVLFVADRAEQAAEIALRLAERMARDDVLPDVRVGLATGTVVSRLGDVFGRTVNLASRLTKMAQPGMVLIDRTTVTALGDHPGFDLSREQVRAVRGLGLVEPAVLTRRRGPAGRGRQDRSTGDRPGEDPRTGDGHLS